jgi:hypothetical protein
MATAWTTDSGMRWQRADTDPGDLPREGMPKPRCPRCEGAEGAKREQPGSVPPRCAVTGPLAQCSHAQRPPNLPSTEMTARSFAPLTLEHLDRLVALATVDHEKFTRPDGRSEYSGLRVAVVLAQGAAQHWVDIHAGAAHPNGVKDLDVWTFYAARPGVRFPADKRETHADFGRSSLGRQVYTPADVATLGPRAHRWKKYTGRRVDFLMRALPVPAGCPLDEAEQAIANWLTAGAQALSAKPPSSWHLSRKAVVGLWPAPLAGRTLWPCSPIARMSRP